MNGMSKNTLEELSSERISDDRTPHIYNILRFAVLKKDRALRAIGGPWDSIDGGDPSVDDTSLIQTARRLLFTLLFIIFTVLTEKNNGERFFSTMWFYGFSL